MIPMSVKLIKSLLILNILNGIIFQIKSQPVLQNMSIDQFINEFAKNTEWMLPIFAITCPSLLDDHIRYTMTDPLSNKIVKEISGKTFDHENLPQLNVGAVSDLVIENCKIPDTISLKSIFDRLGITSKERLCLIYNLQNQDFPYRKEHFLGLDGDLAAIYLDVPLLIALPEDFFVNIQNISKINIIYTKFDKVSSSIAKLTQLKYLTLINNSIPRLRDISLMMIKTLESINISFNKLLESIGKDDFLEVDRLLHLKLSQNQIRTIHPSALRSLVRLKELEIDHNRIEELPAGLLKHCTGLITVDLSHNLIELIPE